MEIANSVISKENIDRLSNVKDKRYCFKWDTCTARYHRHKTCPSSHKATQSISFIACGDISLLSSEDRSLMPK